MPQHKYLACLMVFPVALGCASSDEGCPEPRPQCPYFVTLTVTSSAKEQLTNVEATVSGQQLSCNPTPTGALCEGGGEGSLHVQAPGFEPVDVDSTVTESAVPRCGCATFTRDPSSVTLTPS